MATQPLPTPQRLRIACASPVHRLRGGGGDLGLCDTFCAQGDLGAIPLGFSRAGHYSCTTYPVKPCHGVPLPVPEALSIQIFGTGHALPKTRRATQDIERGLGLAENALQATGVHSRHVATTESQIDLAVEAAQAALADAQTTVAEVDTVIFGASVPYQPIPSTAPLVMRGLGMADGTAAAFDVNSTCLSFLTAFDTAARLIATGQSRKALVVSAEIASRALPWQADPETAALFSDGAAAMVLGQSQPQAGSCVRAVRFRSYPSVYEACEIGAGGTRFDLHHAPQAFAAHSHFAMNGKALFRITTQHFAGFVKDILDAAGWQAADVDLVVPHQASPAGLAHMIRQTGFPPARVVSIAADYGNQVAASIPFAFDAARRDGRINTGDRVLLLGTSAGVSFGGLALVI